MRILADTIRASRVCTRPQAVTVTADYAIVVEQDNVLIDRPPSENGTSRTVDLRPASLPN